MTMKTKSTTQETRTSKKGDQEIDVYQLKLDISEQLHYLLEGGMSHEDIILFLESEKLHWVALHTYETLVAVGWVKEDT